ncbi:MAG: 3-oxoacyl-[acyl-carrier-protein] reductase [Candidatus Eisenbacteria bacterium]|nr:3-oxoacyl-[acyl-carrier-protein] reductase [Candidatus Eisenbacteria bacterium]
MSGIERKTVIVTGGAQGIGKAICLSFAGEGANVVVADMNGEEGQRTADEIKKIGTGGHFCKVDVSRSEESEGLAEEAERTFSPVHILVNNAGVTRDSLLLRMSESDWDLVINVNLKGTFNCTRAVLKQMARQRYGRIVNITSVVGMRGNAGQANYSASKAGIIGFTKSVAKEVASRGITVNAIAPGFIDTPMTQALSEKAREDLFRLIPGGQAGAPQDVANAVLFFASNEASYITGQVLNVDGGWAM